MLNSTRNDYYHRIGRAVEYIENNLCERIALDTVAEKAHFSKYHFIRIFFATTGETVGAYIRKRRISKSALELITTSISILELAIKYQFDSQEAYTRSFKKVFKTPPGKYRKHGIKQIGYGRCGLTPERLKHIRDNIAMTPEITEIKDKTLVGIGSSTSLVKNQIHKLWNDFLAIDTKITNKKDCWYYELHKFDKNFRIANFSDSMNFEKWAMVEINLDSHFPSDISKYELKGGKYAVFIHKGEISKIQLSIDYIYGTWLINSDYDLDSRDDFERYGDNYLGPHNPNSKTEIWIPIK